MCESNLQIIFKPFKLFLYRLQSIFKKKVHLGRKHDKVCSTNIPTAGEVVLLQYTHAYMTHTYIHTTNTLITCKKYFRVHQAY